MTSRARRTNTVAANEFVTLALLMDQDNIEYHAIHSCVSEVEPGVLRIIIRDERNFANSAYFFLKALKQDVFFGVHFGGSVQTFVSPGT